MALHVYGVVPAATPLPDGLHGRQEARLRLVVHGDIAAIASEVEADARVRRDDLLAHARVLETLAEGVTVLPMQFGVIVENDEEVARNILEAGEISLASLLKSFDGLVQLTVKAYHDEDQALRDLLRERPEIRTLRDQIASAPTSYQSQIRLGEAIAVGLGDLAGADAAMLNEELSGLAERIVLQEASGRNQVLDAALLVKRDARTRTDEGIARLSRTLPDRLQLRYIGPQPPYSFIDVELAGERVWA
ncbi:MAG TPA: GvpL/GvpF family gas vesicle protein [Dehalococcoidia bacterium]|nr:GvpL/GvpF family gas vesicle protein [Dehalococcoidia bacterium]